MNPLKEYKDFVVKITDFKNNLFLKKLNNVIKDELVDLFKYLKEKVDEEFCVIEGENEHEYIKLRPIEESDKSYYFEDIEGFSV